MPDSVSNIWWKVFGSHFKEKKNGTINHKAEFTFSHVIYLMSHIIQILHVHGLMSCLVMEKKIVWFVVKLYHIFIKLL